MKEGVAIVGAGAVSPAGWSASALAEAVREARELPAEIRSDENGWGNVTVRGVPAPEGKAIRHPRLRRASAVVKYSVAAALEALGADRLEAIRAGEWRLGIIVNVVNGCVGYSRRFYGEVLEDPGTASPILFPETVFNSIGSHVAAVLGTTAVNYTILGDATQFLSGLDLAAGWLERDMVDGCLVIGAEELDWLSYDAVNVFARGTVVTEGAGAIYLERSSEPAVELAQVTAAFPYGAECAPEEAAAAMRDELPAGLPDEIDFLDLPRGSNGGSEVALRATLGFGIAATTAWQTVLAREFLVAERCRNALVLGYGSDQQAIGAHLRKN